MKHVFSGLSVLAFYAVSASAAATAAPCPTFDQFNTSEVFEGPFAPLGTFHGKTKRFRTVISSQAEGPVNFAGRYRIVSWGCGSPCHAFAVIDKKTGDVWDMNVSAALGAAFRPNSYLFVIDTPEMIKESSFAPAVTIFYSWNAKKHSLVELPECSGTSNQPLHHDASGGLTAAVVAGERRR